MGKRISTLIQSSFNMNEGHHQETHQQGLSGADEEGEEGGSLGGSCFEDPL